MRPADSPFVSIVIPVFNSETLLAPLVEELLERLTGLYRLEIILVNDASRDGSEKVCVSLYRRYPNVIKVLSLARNAGEHRAVMTGLRQVSGDYAVVMDDDGQNPPSQVPVLVQELLSGNHDVVYGAYRKKYHPAWRNAVSFFYNTAARVMLRKPAGLYLSSFKVLNRKILNRMLELPEIPACLDAVVLKTAQSVGQVTVEHLPRKSGRSGYSLFKLGRLGMSFFMAPRDAGASPLAAGKTWGCGEPEALI